MTVVISHRKKRWNRGAESAVIAREGALLREMGVVDV
jgi:hypothetical protein